MNMIIALCIKLFSWDIPLKKIKEAVDEELKSNNEGAK